MAQYMVDGLTLAWCTNRDEARSLAEFFARHVTPDYISHGEIQEGRAVDLGSWSPDLVDILVEEMQRGIANDFGCEDTLRVLAVHLQGELVAIALVSFHKRLCTSYAIIEDLIVTTSRRGQGLGSVVLQWIEQEASKQGFSRLYLESGIHNQRAHAFFEKQGFRISSIVMMKPLDG